MHDFETQYITSTGFPEIKIDISDDGMTAKLNLKPGRVVHPIDIQWLESSLIQKGIKYGLLQKQLEKTVTSWNRYGHTPPGIICARGRAFRQGRIDAWKNCRPALTEHKTIMQLKKSGPLHVSKLKERKLWDYLVKPGETILEALWASPPDPAVRIDGEKVFPESYGSKKMRIGWGIKEDFSTGRLKADDYGLAIMLQNHLELFPVETDTRLGLQNREDGMQVWLIIECGVNAEEFLRPDHIQKFLTEKKVTRGLREEEIITAVSHPHEIGKRIEILIAEGECSRNGTDGRLEYFVTQNIEEPDPGSDHRIDFKKLQLVTNVKPGDVLAKRIPAEQGIPGFKPDGTIIPAQNGKPVELPMGSNTRISPHHSDLLIAARGGHAVIFDGRIQVRECLNIEGDVDYGTGNIDYDLSIAVLGDIKAGFQTNCGGDLDVHGVTEDARVRVQGNALLRKGFFGQGKGRLEVMGNLQVLLARNQTIHCHGNILTGKEILHCQVMSRKSVSVEGLIAGGRCKAVEMITCKVAGNKAGSKTELSTGTDFYLLEEMERIQLRLDELKKYKRNLELNNEWLLKMEKDRSILPSEERRLHRELKKRLEEVVQKTREMEEMIKILHVSAYKETQPKIIVTDCIYPGVTIRLKKANYVIKEFLKGKKMFFLKNGVVCIKESGEF